jgi:hypothetical protein
MAHTMRSTPVLTPLILIALASLCGCARISQSSANQCYRKVSFPPVGLSDGERIESVEVVVSCARFAAIHHIPDDWSVEVVSPVSEVSTLKAAAGHGSTSLWSSRDLTGFITIMVCEPSCFTIKANMVVLVGERERTVSFSQSDLIMSGHHMVATKRLDSPMPIATARRSIPER